MLSTMNTQSGLGIVVKKWSRFKLIMSSLTAKGSAYEMIQIDNSDGSYRLCILNDVQFHYELSHKDESDKADYEDNFQASFLVANCQTDQ